ncbi:unnamed protein product [Candidula unifasciata]|uniref:Polysaccharide lyase 14 domain-containing protein n=1 Tax=Candidula unifasciata TaxID=100452 RepID=A0A8S3YDU4_9EUPU|nr:unnamed protein product [Candidula unifasciata]
MMLQLLMAVCLGALCAQGKTVSNFDHYDCAQVPAETTRWKATVSLTKPVYLVEAVGGEVTFIQDDGQYLEIVGTEQKPNNYVCLSIHGKYSGEAPKAVVHVKPLKSSSDVTTREIRSIKIRRATDVWHLSSVPSTSNIKTLLQGFEPYVHKWGDDSMSSSTAHISSPALAVHYAKGSYSQTKNVRGVGLFTTPNGLSSSADDLVLNYDIYFDNFGWGRMGKLPGLYGGVQGEGAYQCSGGNNPSTCFSLRLMWRSGGDGELYAYIPSNQESGFNDRDDVIANSDYGQSIGRGKIRFQNGVWQTVTEQVHLNTIGHTDGWVKFCNQVHGGGSQQCYTASNLRMRNSAGHHLRGLFFSTFFGGSQPDDAAPNDCHTHFKELRIQVPDGAVVG